MTIFRSGLIVALTMALTTTSAEANTITFDAGGGGNFDNIPEAMFRGTANDTVLVMPGYYEVEEGIPYPWPVPLTSDSPSLVSHGGAETTMILGDGSLPAFVVAESRYGARVLISGFKFRSLETPFDWDGPAYGAEVSFTDNIVEECETGVDIRWGSGTVARNVIAGPGYYGIMCPYFSGSIEDNEVSGFTDAGIISTNENTTLHGNHIHDNVELAVHTCAGDLDPPTDFDATMNWWGTTDPVSVADAIWDCHDSEWAGICFVVEPRRTSPGCDPTGVLERTTWGNIKSMHR